MNPITLLVTIVFAVIGALLFVSGLQLPGIGFGILAVFTLFSLKMANNWERFVILRAGKLSSVKGPGLFMIIPVIDAITAVIDERIQTTQFNAEQALTRDTVPVNVDAVIFWHVHDAQRAALNITDYRSGHRPGGADVLARNDRLLASVGAAGRAQGGRRGAARRDRAARPPTGAFRSIRSRSATSPFRSACRTPCRARRRPSARRKRA